MFSFVNIYVCMVWNVIHLSFSVKAVINISTYDEL